MEYRTKLLLLPLHLLLLKFPPQLKNQQLQQLFLLLNLQFLLQLLLLQIQQHLQTLLLLPRSQHQHQQPPYKVQDPELQFLQMDL